MSIVSLAILNSVFKLIAGVFILTANKINFFSFDQSFLITTDRRKSKEKLTSLTKNTEADWKT